MQSELHCLGVLSSEVRGLLINTEDLPAVTPVRRHPCLRTPLSADRGVRGHVGLLGDCPKQTPKGAVFFVEKVSLEQTQYQNFALFLNFVLSVNRVESLHCPI